jgi:hypothetical protein
MQPEPMKNLLRQLAYHQEERQHHYRKPRKTAQAGSTIGKRCQADLIDQEQRVLAHIKRVQQELKRRKTNG